MKLLLVILSLALALEGCNGFAYSSSNTPSKNFYSNDRGEKSGGFGKSTNSVPIQHIADTDATLGTLLDFLRSQGSEVQDGCEVGTSSTTGRRGVYATRPFKKNQIVCKIPSDLALALSNPQLGGADAPTYAHCGRNFLDMYVTDPVASQTWKPYLDTLPSDVNSPQFSATPDFFSDEEIAQLEFPRIINDTRQRQQDIIDLSSQSQDLDLHQLQFATWLVSSRAYSLSIEEQVTEQTKGFGAGVIKPSKTIRVMLPYIDLVNHSDNPNGELHLIDPEKDEAWFAVRATRPIPAGREVSIGYGSGASTSVDLLSNYGFVNENKFDKFLLKKGGDDCIESIDGWNTSLEQDEQMLQNGGLTDNEIKVLEFRCQLKRSYQ